MPYDIGAVVQEVSAAVGRRWRELDPLLPSPPGQIEPDAEWLVADGRDGRPAGFAVCRHVRVPDNALEQTWGAAAKFVLRPRVMSGDATGRDMQGVLGGLLGQWSDHLAGLPSAHADDSAALVTWPSRDPAGVLPLIRHGLQPFTVLAARRAQAQRTDRSDRSDRSSRSETANRPGRNEHNRAEHHHEHKRQPPGLTIRTATSADLDAVVDLELGVIWYDAQFGVAVPRQSTDRLIRADARNSLARNPGWTWLAERGGRPIGLLVVAPPADAGWAAPLVRSQSAAYLEAMFVRPGERGVGVGAALVAAAHQALDELAVPVTLLHYAQVNPVSGPFWSRMGYRPLWTTWEIRPAAALRNPSWRANSRHGPSAAR